MSGAARFVKKTFKKKFKIHKKYWKVAAIAVAAYFTFGLALGAMAPAAGTVAAGTGAAATGTGVMTATAATATGTAAGAAATVGAIETVTVTAAAAGAGTSAAAAGAAIAGGAAAASAGGGGGSVNPAKPAPQQPVQTQQPANPSMLDKAKGAWKDMSFSDKLLLAKAGVDVATAVTAPSPEEEAAAAAKWQGAYYGMTAAEAEKAQAQVGKTQYVQQAPAAQKPPGSVPGKAGQMARNLVPGAPGEQAPDGQQPPEGHVLPPTQRMQFQATAEQPQAAPAPTPEQVTNVGGNRDLFAQRAPGVRYLV